MVQQEEDNRQYDKGDQHARLAAGEQGQDYREDAPATRGSAGNARPHPQPPS